MIAIAAVVVVVVAVIAFMFMGSGGNEELSGQWTVSGGSMYVKTTLDNDTANAYEITETINASTEIIDFDEPDQEVGDMTFMDLGNGKFKIIGFDEVAEGIGDIDGTYDIDGDTMTANINETASYMDATMGFVEYEFDITWELERV